jgi:alpha,alpha-trehalose phosphorylase
MAKLHFKFAYEFAMKYADQLNEVFTKVNINFQTLEMFNQASNHMTLLVDEKKKIIKQDASFLDKKNYDLSKIPRENFPLLLSYHPMDLYRHQIIKQADAVLALVLQKDVDEEIYRNSFNYYLKRTTHDSSLSRCIHSIAGYHLGYEDLAYDYFKMVCDLDFRDSHNRTQHGLHVANLGGSYLTMVYGLFGLRFDDILSLNPAKQTHLSSIKTKIKYLGADIWLELTPTTFKLKTNKPIDVSIYGQKHHLEQTLKIKL